MIKIVLATIVLTAVYGLTLASADPWDLGLGVVLSLVALIAFRDFLFPRHEPAPGPALESVIRFPLLVFATAGEIVRGTIAVTRAVLSRSGPQSAGFVEIAAGERTQTGVAVNGLLLTLSPGSVLVEIDPAARTWTVHVLDASDTDAVRDHVDRFYDRYQRPIWP